MAAAGTSGGVIAGTIRVKDADTIEVAGVSIRLHGIDAPEVKQRCGGDGQPTWACGAWVTNQAREMFQGQYAQCEAVDQDRYGRTVARCRVDGRDMGRVLVEQGLAFAYRKYSWDYDLDEKSAAISGRGLHGTGVEVPAIYRAQGRKAQAVSALQSAPNGCVIKGNISAKGVRIFHEPGQKWYGATRISTDRGERWFCSAAQAGAAGWRRAKK